MTSQIGKGKPLSSQSKEILFNLFKYFEKKHGFTDNPVTLVSVSTGVSYNSVKRVIAENTLVQEGKQKTFSSPKRTRDRKCTKDIDKFDKEAIKRIIINFHATEGRYPTLKVLHNKLVQEINYSASVSTLRKHVFKLGFKWKKVDNKKVLIEKQDKHCKDNFGNTGIAQTHSHSEPNNTIKMWELASQNQNFMNLDNS